MVHIRPFFRKLLIFSHMDMSILIDLILCLIYSVLLRLLLLHYFGVFRACKMVLPLIGLFGQDIEWYDRYVTVNHSLYVMTRLRNIRILYKHRRTWLIVLWLFNGGHVLISFLLVSLCIRMLKVAMNDTFMLLVIKLVVDFHEGLVIRMNLNILLYSKSLRINLSLLLNNWHLLVNLWM